MSCGLVIFESAPFCPRLLSVEIISARVIAFLRAMVTLFDDVYEVTRVRGGYDAPAAYLLMDSSGIVMSVRTAAGMAGR